MIDFANTLLAEPTAFQTNRVNAVGMRFARTHRFGKRKNVSGDDRAAADIGMSANPAKLVHGTHRSYYGPFFHGNVTGQSRSVHQHRMIAYRTIMADVRISQHQHMAANGGEAAAFHGSPV